MQHPILALSVAVLFSGPVAIAQTCPSHLVSANPTGQSGNGESGHPSISANGQWTTFQSSATDLDPGVTSFNGVEDVFLYDRVAGTVVLVSRSLTNPNAEANGRSIRPSISADGTVIVFHSPAGDLVANDTNLVDDVFVYDRTTGGITCASVDLLGVPAGGSWPAISADGTAVAFSSSSTSLAGGGTNGQVHVFVRDRLAGTTELVSADSVGTQGNGISTYPAITAAGRYVTFYSEADNLIAGGTTRVGNIFRRDRNTGTTILVSRSTGGVEGNARCDNSAISGDGRIVVFESFASNLVSVDTNGAADVFVHDCVTGSTILVSESNLRPGDSGDGLSDNPWISESGRYVVFHSLATDLVPADLNGFADIFIRDLVRGVTERASLGCGGTEPNGDSDVPRISPDGRWITFESRATNLVSHDSNGFSDVFVRDACMWPIENYCTAGISSNLCVPSMSASGAPCVSQSSGFVVTCSGLEGQRFGLIFYGVSGRLAMPWGAQSSSYFCVAPQVQRTPPQISGGTAGTCTGSISVDWLDFIATNPGALGVPFTFGEVVDAQCWYRDPPAPRTTNLSDAIEWVTCP
jgi:Tol biopolymer transport system component